MEENGQSELEAKLGDKSVRFKTKHMAEFISLLLLAVTGAGLVFFWQHLEDTKRGLKDIADAHRESFKELATTNKHMVAEQRMQTCLFSLPEQERKTEYAAPYGFCKRMSQ